MHAVKSIFQPWDLNFQPKFEAIATESQQITNLANVAVKAEVRDTRLEVVQSKKNWEWVVRQMDELKGENQRLVDLLQAKFGMMESSLLGE